MAMTEREMLELAALAAGLRIDKSETNGGGVGNDGFCITGDAMLDWHNNIRWNPLTDDGDALRLAADLRLLIKPGKHPGDGCTVESRRPGVSGCTSFQDDKREQMRRAIVIVAAEIGKAMQEGK